MRSCDSTLCACSCRPTRIVTAPVVLTKIRIESEAAAPPNSPNVAPRFRVARNELYGISPTSTRLLLAYFEPLQRTITLRRFVFKMLRGGKTYRAAIRLGARLRPASCVSSLYPETLPLCLWLCLDALNIPSHFSFPSQRSGERHA